MSVEVVVAPSPIEVLVPYLSGVLAVPVAYTVPDDDRPASFVSFAVTGGGGRHSLVLQDATVSVDCWAESALEASNLASLVEGHILAAPRALASVYDVSQYGAPSDFPDDLSGHARFRATYSLTLRATAL